MSTVRYSRFQIFRHNIVKKYKSRALKRKWLGSIRFLCEYESSRNQFSGSENQFHTKFLWAYSLHKSIHFVVFNYIVPKYLKPTIVHIVFYANCKQTHAVYAYIKCYIAFCTLCQWCFSRQIEQVHRFRRNRKIRAISTRIGGANCECQCQAYGEHARTNTKHAQVLLERDQLVPKYSK